MITFNSLQLASMVSHYFFPFIRILALLSTAPLFAEKTITKKLKIGLAMMITFLVGPTLPLTDDHAQASFTAIGLIFQQVAIGATLGFTMQLAFSAVKMAGEIIGLQMGLSFATFFDPSAGPNTPMIARILNTLFLLLFLCFNGHLWLISMLGDSFYTLPISDTPLNSGGFMAVAMLGGTIFTQGLKLALPLIGLLLTLNIVLGLLNRLTPQLSVFVIGFPVTLLAGLASFTLLMSMLAPFAEHLFTQVLHNLSLVLNTIGGILPR